MAAAAAAVPLGLGVSAAPQPERAARSSCGDYELEPLPASCSCEEQQAAPPPPSPSGAKAQLWSLRKGLAKVARAAPGVLERIGKTRSTSSASSASATAPEGGKGCCETARTASDAASPAVSSRAVQILQRHREETMTGGQRTEPRTASSADAPPVGAVRSARSVGKAARRATAAVGFRLSAAAMPPLRRGRSTEPPPDISMDAVAEGVIMHEEDGITTI